jgi:hypothetical protein
MEISYPRVIENTFFSAALGTFSKINHILGHTVSLNSYKKTVTLFYILSDKNLVFWCHFKNSHTIGSIALRYW